MRVKALASGSSGNAYLVWTERNALLLEAGLSAFTLEGLLRTHGIPMGHLAGILVSHEHGDHCQGARTLSRRWRAPIIGSEGTLARLCPGAPEGTKPRKNGPLVRAVIPNTAYDVAEFRITPFRVSHDAAQPCGFLVEAEGWRVCLATDLGEPNAEVRAALRQAHLLILEANHDLDLLRNGDYPAILKQRIMSAAGHLSNDDCASLLAEACCPIDVSPLVSRRQRQTMGHASSGESTLLTQDAMTIPLPQTRQVWLAHLSAHNNTPRKAREAATRALHTIGLSNQIRVEIAGRDRPSLIWRSEDFAFVQARLL